PTQVREYARLSLATHEGRGRRRRTRWHQLRVQHLDRHPHEHKIRTARKGQRVEIEGFPQVHHYKDKETGEPRTFRYIEVTSFRPRPGRRLYQPGDLSAR
ncbi:MAG: single-stranded DNA-binding protein, partial [bacterium]